jgi:hypothetical protein
MLQALGTMPDLGCSANADTVLRQVASAHRWTAAMFEELVMDHVLTPLQVARLVVHS